MSIVKLNNRGVRSATSFGSASAIGSMVFIKKVTASSSSTISFVDGSSSVVLDDTYKEYLFTFKNIHPSANQNFEFNVSIDTGSNYNVAKTTSFFRAQHLEGGHSQVFSYETGDDLAQGTGVARISNLCGTENDMNVSGYLYLFNPSSTTFVKHFMSRVNSTFTSSDATVDLHMAGYANTTSAVDAVQFSFTSGNIDAGDICLYGITT